MKITDVRIRLISNEDSKLKGVASVTIDDCFVVHDVKILQGSTDFIIAMPSRKTADGEYRDIIHPINTQTREMMRDEVIKAFQQAQLKSTEE